MRSWEVGIRYIVRGVVHCTSHIVRCRYGKGDAMRVAMDRTERDVPEALAVSVTYTSDVTGLV